MQKVISLILILALICMSSVSVFAEGSAENDDSAYGPRGSSTKYFYDNTGKYRLEDGLFRIFAGANSRDLLEEEITIAF